MQAVLEDTKRTMSWKMKYSPLRLSRLRTCAVLTLDPSSVR